MFIVLYTGKPSSVKRSTEGDKRTVSQSRGKSNIDVRQCAHVNGNRPGNIKLPVPVQCRPPVGLETPAQDRANVGGRQDHKHAKNVMRVKYPKRPGRKSVINRSPNFVRVQEYDTTYPGGANKYNITHQKG